MNLSNLIYEISIWSICVPLITGMVFYRRLDKPSCIIFYLIILALIPQLITEFKYCKPVLNLIYNAYTPIEFLLIYLFIGREFRRRLARNCALVIAGLFISLFFFLIIRYGMNKRFLNELVCGANIAYLCWILMYILESIWDEKKLLDPQLPLFWHITALILYTPCTVLVFALYYYIDTSKNIVINNLWIIHGIFNTHLYLFFAIGFYKNKFNQPDLNNKIKFILNKDHDLQ